MTKKKGSGRFVLWILILTILISAAFLSWTKFRYLFNNQNVLDNKKYPLALDSVRTIKQKLYKQKANKAELAKNFHLLTNKTVFPYWYGTKWDFNGTTETPNEGSIACGYFVTTVLRDMGVPIKRTKMAQCASEEMIRSLVSKKNIYHLSGLKLEEFEKNLKKLGYGLYVIGLDNHTGFISFSQEGCYFIHSSGYYPFQVVKEKVSESKVLSKSKYKVIGKLTSDEGFLKGWVRHQQL
jgi:hypothetical protein